MMTNTVVPPLYECETCRDLRHVPSGDAFVRCPACYTRRHITRELAVRQYPAAWVKLEPTLVLQMFQPGSLVSHTMEALLQGQQRLVHAFDMPTDRRQAFVGALTYGFLERGWGAQVLDSADLAFKHFMRDSEQWTTIERRREAVIFTLGREVEHRLGFFYLRSLLDRAVQHRLPFVLLTDYPLEVHAPRYPDLMPVIQAARFDLLNLSLSDFSPHHASN